MPADMRPSIASSSHSIADARRQIEICASLKSSGPPRSLPCARIRSSHRRAHADLPSPSATNARLPFVTLRELCPMRRTTLRRTSTIRQPVTKGGTKDNQSKRNCRSVCEIFYSLIEARIVIESWRRHYNTLRPHGPPGYKPPAPEVFMPALAARAASQSRPATPPTLAPKPSMH
jgi:hypothetical protein